MDFNFNTSNNNHNNSPSPSSSTSSSTPQQLTSTTATSQDPMHSWWESVSKQRSRILSLSSLLSANSLSSLADSDRPALSFLSSSAAYSLLSAAISVPLSGSGSDTLCQWLYETYLTSDPQLRLIVLSFIPLLTGVYMSRIHSFDSSSSPSMAGFEAVLLAVYTAEAKSRGGKPILVEVADLSQASLYHTPRGDAEKSDASAPASVGVLSPPLEPQIAVKSTKRASIVGVALHCYFKQISHMPAWSKLEFCKFATAWAGQDCPCKEQLDGEDKDERNGLGSFAISNGNGHDREIDIEDKLSSLGIDNDAVPVNPLTNGVRIPLPWELLQPMLRILGHCLLGPLSPQNVKDAASIAVRCLYARASHELLPQAIIATRSLINLDKSSRISSTSAAPDTSSNPNTPSKAKKPEIFLVSK